MRNKQLLKSRAMMQNGAWALEFRGFNNDNWKQQQRKFVCELQWVLLQQAEYEIISILKLRLSYIYF